jgi:hypothetical protein
VRNVRAFYFWPRFLNFGICLGHSNDGNHLALCALIAAAQVVKPDTRAPDQNWFSTDRTAFKILMGVPGEVCSGFEPLISCDSYYPASQLWSSVTSQPCFRKRYHCYYNKNTFGIGENGAGVSDVVFEEEVPLAKFLNTQAKILVARKFNSAMHSMR